MMNDDRHLDVLLLLSLSPLAVGCPGDDGSPSESTTESSSSTGLASDGGQSTGPAQSTGRAESTGSDESTGSTSSTPDPMTTTGLEDTGTSTGMADADDTGTTGDATGGLQCDIPLPVVGPIDPVCVGYTAQVNECFYEDTLPQECIDLYEAYCQSSLDNSLAYGEACQVAVTEFYACLSQLECNEIFDPCPDELAAIDMACVAF